MVEKVVIKDSGVSEEKVRELERRAASEKDEIRKEAQRQLNEMKQAQNKSERERKALEEKLQREASEADRAEKARKALQSKLKQMEEKLLIGGQLMDKAARQESELRQAELELEERRRQEKELARELAEKEEQGLVMEEQYVSLQDEVEVKTKKLKKLWSKYQGCKSEVKDLQVEFQREREDMLDTIRELSRQLKQKQLFLEHFVPPEEVEKLTLRSQWDEESDAWTLSRLEFAGNS